MTNHLTGRSSGPLLVSFSGLDGAGKSTQIENLRSVLEVNGCHTRLLAFWDDVVVFARYREAFVHRVLHSEPGIGAPGKPVQRRDKNVRRWYLTLMRHGLYFADALHLTWVLHKARKTMVASSREERPSDRTITQVLILDRYIYDQLANLPLRNWLTRLFIRVVQAIVPPPDIAYLLDADEASARIRKPEYPLDFMRESRASYYELARLLGNLTIIPPLDLPQAKRRVLEEFWKATQTPLPPDTQKVASEQNASRA